MERFLKINENGHSFAIIFYVRKDGLMATYHPDFIVATADKVYLIETKGDDKVDDANVRQKQTATIEWIKKINALEPEDRMNRTWGVCIGRRKRVLLVEWKRRHIDRHLQPMQGDLLKSYRKSV